MSIGSETDGGASAILVTDLSIDGADNGIRIKSNSTRGGLVHDVVYEDVRIRDTKNPIYMDSNYSASTGPTHDKLPTFTAITLRKVRVESAGKITLESFDQKHRLGITFDNVTLKQASDIKVFCALCGSHFGPWPGEFSSRRRRRFRNNEYRRGSSRRSPERMQREVRAHAIEVEVLPVDEKNKLAADERRLKTGDLSALICVYWRLKFEHSMHFRSRS